jgi:hypothetical protein
MVPDRRSYLKRRFTGTPALLAEHLATTKRMTVL